MDIVRHRTVHERWRRRLIYGAPALAALIGLSLVASRLKPAAPGMDANAIYTDAVRQGDLQREVRGNGTLVPEEIHWIPVTTPGRVTAIRVLPGAPVTANTVMVVLSNPEVEHAAFEAEWQLKAAEAHDAKLRVQLESARLAQEATAAALHAEHTVAKLDAEADAQLAEEKLVDRLTAIRSRTKAEQLGTRADLEDRRLRILEDAHRAELAAQEADLARLRAVHELRLRQRAELEIRAGIDGVLQRLGEYGTLQVGQQFAAGANIARVADPTRLKAEIRVVETQAKDIQPGQTARVDTRNGVVSGRVVRVDPAVQNGTVLVDVTLAGPLPKGARPDLSVEGTIELERLANVLYVGRPVNGQSESTVSLYKLVKGGREAIRTPVRLGRSSVNAIEVLSGLALGDRIILSDMTPWESHDRVRLN